MLIGKKRGIRTPEFHKKMERRKWIRLSIFIAILIIFISIPIYFFRTSRFLISVIEISGNSVTPSEDIQFTVNENLEGNYFFIFPKSNIVLYPKKTIAAQLIDTNPRFKSVDMKITGPRSIKVYVKEREPYAEYCQDISDQNSPIGCYFMDKTGFIFSEAPAFSHGVYSIYGSNPTLENPLRMVYMEEPKLTLIEPFIKSLAEVNLYPKVFLLKGDEYHLILSNGAVIMWKAEEDLEKVKSNLESFLRDPSFKKGSGELDNVLYIDLRFGNKIFYKFRDSI